ncbi:MAG TPA: GlsB/YeaQ/YmgE family stress response membrane protein [Xanthobacteraceae bacterium]|nr:GlsB/YeaQ/YmgE family stress response membrane protein [Xanthobacteraceae bacterium]
MFSLIWAAIIGLIVGALAKFIMPGKDPGGILITMALGVVGSIVATWIGRAIGWYREGQSAGFLMSIAGAILLLYIYRLVRGRTARA